jgi:hypothetical protein
MALPNLRCESLRMEDIGRLILQLSSLHQGHQRKNVTYQESLFTSCQYRTSSGVVGRQELIEQYRICSFLPCHLDGSSSEWERDWWEDGKGCGELGQGEWT